MALLFKILGTAWSAVGVGGTSQSLVLLPYWSVLYLAIRLSDGLRVGANESMSFKQIGRAHV